MSHAPRLHRHNPHYRTTPTRRSRVIRRLLGAASLTVILFSAGAAFRADTPATAAAPGITATLSVSPLGSQVPGTTLTYTATIANTGALDATGVQFDAPIDANATQFGVAKVSPNATDGGRAER